MTITIPVLWAVALVNVLGGVLLALLVLKSQETFPKVAPVSGIAFGGIAIWSQLVVGDRLNPTFPELEALVLTAAVSALAGLVVVFSTLQAEPTR
jgi:hypothetical protein